MKNGVAVFASTLGLSASVGFLSAPQKLPSKILKEIPRLEVLLKAEAPLTSSVLDAVTDVPFLDRLNPNDPEPLSLRPRGRNGAFLVNGGGHFIIEVESYCLKAGTHGPSRGAGYVYAPLKGARSGLIQAVLSRAWDHPNVPRRDIQVLIWAVLSRAKLDKAPRSAAATAEKLLTPVEIRELEGGAMDAVPADVLRKAMAQLPTAARGVLMAESNLRAALGRSAPAYQDIEKVAVLAGEASAEGEVRRIPRGRWSYHPKGYFVRYFPKEYFRSVVEVYSPQDYLVERDGSGRIVAVVAPDADRLEFAYDDGIGTISPTRDPALKADAFKSIRLLRVYPKTAGTTTVGEWMNVGWIFRETSAGRGARTKEVDRFPDLNERTARATALRSELGRLVEGIRKLRFANAPRPTERDMEEIFSLGLAADAVAAVPLEPGLVRKSATVDPVGLILKAWMSEFGRIMKPVGVSGEMPRPYPARLSWAGGELSSGPSLGFAGGESSQEAGDKDEIDPSDGSGEPGRPGSQREGFSNRNTRPDDSCAGAYDACKEMAQGDWFSCGVVCLDKFEDRPREFGECHRACQDQLGRDQAGCRTLTQACLEKK